MSRIQNFQLKMNPDGTQNVVASYLPGSDEMWETIEHPARFKNPVRAENFLARVSSNRYKIHLKNWIFEGHICSPIQPKNQPKPYVVDPEFKA